MDKETVSKLREWGLESLIHIFEENEISLNTLPLLDDETLKCLVPKIGPRLIIKKKIADILARPNKEDISLETCSDICSFHSDEASTSTNVHLPFTVRTNLDLSTSTSLSHEGESLETIYTVLPLESEVAPKKPKLTIANNFKDFDLKDLLHKTCMGKAIINIYETNKNLDSRSQGYLVDIICQHLLNAEYSRMTNADFNVLSTYIVSLFPNESKDVYYTTPVRKRHSRDNKSGVARGKLVDKYRNKLTYLRKAKIFTSSNFLNSSDEKENSPNTSISESTAADDNVLWLKNNSEPWTEVLNKWNSTFSIRQVNINKDIDIDEIFQQWPILGNSLGYTLIDQDFDRTFPEKSGNLFSHWETYFNKVLELRQHTLNATDKLLLDILKSGNLDTEYKHYMQLILLASLIPSKARYGKGTKQWKPTLTESREGIIVRVELPADVTECVNHKRNKFNKLGITVQPFIIVEIEGNKVKCLYVSVHNSFYKVQSVLKSIDLCFKTFHVLNLQYPIESEHLWFFIQKTIYNIDTKFDNKIPFVMDIINKVRH